MIGRACSALLLAACGAACASVDVVDDRGRRIELASTATRIVALAPHLAEIAFAAGAGERVLGVSAATDLPGAARLPVVADSGRIDFERLLRLRPDAVLAWQSGNPRAQVEHLERLGIAVLVTEVRTLSDIPRVTRLVGRLTGMQETAERAARGMEREMAGLVTAVQGAAPRVFVEIWNSPLMTVSGAHLIGDMVRACGGRNVFETARGLTPAVSREALLKAAPDVVISSASRRSGAHYIDARALHGFGPRALDAARELCAAFREPR
jgi:iron complex transport system substrate-binding protein